MNHKMSQNLKEMIVSEAVKDLIQHALDQDFNKANKIFTDAMSIKVQDVLDQEHVKLADQIYNGVEPDELDDEDDFMGDEDGVDEIDTDGEADDEFESDGETEEKELELEDEEEEETYDSEEESE